MLRWPDDESSKLRAKMGEAIKALVKEFDTHPYEINCGMCEDFADEIEKRVAGSEVIWGEQVPEMFTEHHDADMHCFIRFGGMYFDAEEPFGVDHPAKLPLYQRQLHGLGVAITT